ncbi:MAG TPA: hypothetical protein VFI42_15590 [Thermomicrobiaceae bacterium]|nr:hypothetical protein [Thermomicrobiaceae bacterium]
MAHIPKDDIQQLWNALPSRNWSSLHKWLEHQKGTTNGISDNLVDDMLRLSQRNEQSGKSFPSSMDQLYQELNSELHG